MTLLGLEWLWLLFGVPAMVALMLWSAWRRDRAIGRFFGSRARRPWTGRPLPRRFWLRSALIVAAFAAVAAGLARPAHSPRPKPVQRPAREVVFVIDVSRSMLARDIRPNRLDRAKLAVSDAMETVRGERIGIVAFAGSAVVKCPLTTDVGFARLALDSLSPESVGRGGTAIGDGIRSALQLLGVDAESPPTDADEQVFRDIILITDGEDHETEPLAAADDAARAGVRIIAVGFGSELTGSTIPGVAGNAVQEYQGEPVTTRQDPRALEAIARKTPGGVFFNVGTGSIEMDRVYARLMQDRSRTQIDASPAMRWTESFQWFLGAALVCLCLEPLLGAPLFGRARA